jgi:SAM-dependent methyltransferase
MTCACGGFCDAAGQQFSAKLAARQLDRYRAAGPGPTTRLLRDGLAAAGAVRGAVLDIGGGIGALALELLARGATGATIVDASPAYVAAAGEEARRRGRSDVVRIIHADFLAIEDQLPTADVVTLDRVVCCYPAFVPLLEGAMRHSTRWLALSYPHDRWYVRSFIAAENQIRRACGGGFRGYVHSTAAIADLIRGGGFVRRHRAGTLAWAVDVYERRP